MVMDVRKAVLLAITEVTYDTDPVPSATVNAIMASAVTVKEMFGVVARDEQWKTLDKLPSVLGDRMGEITFETPVLGSGAAGTAPRLGVLHKAAGQSETILSNTSVTYAPTSANHQSCTIYVYLDGRLHKFTGCMGTGKLVFAAGKKLVIKWTFQGRWAAPTVTSLPATVTYETTAKVPPVCKSCTLTYNAYIGLVIANVEFDDGNKVIKRPSLSDPNAIVGFEITDRNPKITLDPESQFITSFNFRGDVLATTRGIIIAAAQAAGNTITLNVPQANLAKVDYGAANNIVLEKLEAECAANNGDDSYSIVYT